MKLNLCKSYLSLDLTYPLKGNVVADTDNLWKIYDNISELVRFSDAKATVILATNGVIAGFYFSNIVALKDILTDRPIAFIPLEVAIFFVFVSALWSAHCLFPRLKTEKECDVIFFSDIVKKHKIPTDYEKAIREAFSNDNAILNSQLSCQIWQVSKVAQCKYDAVKESIGFLAVAIGASIALILTAIWR
jgi:hypothetical protein